MRRRQAYALQNQLAKDRNALIYTETPKPVLEVIGSVKKTACQYCSKEIGRGLYMHEKYCKAK